ncbi:uncharacterized protein [Typha latifolia]|uniref:uncharacterized protein isoform X4 n=1 Tax=Typha latifolia TaxID=4733 RepID=UPI003C2BD4BB
MRAVELAEGDPTALLRRPPPSGGRGRLGLLNGVVGHGFRRPHSLPVAFRARQRHRFRRRLPRLETGARAVANSGKMASAKSTAKVMACCRKSDPASLYLMQQPNCLAVPYLKSMVSAGLITLASSSYDLPEAVLGKRNLNVLCIGHGGGSLPLFLASKIQGATVHIVDIDPIVISASIKAMGFPASAVKGTSDELKQSADADKLLWEGVHDRLFLYRSDAEEFIINSTDTYDLVFIDAYDGDDIFPVKLWDTDSQFLRHLQSRVDPIHGTVVVNLHSDSDLLTTNMEDNSQLQSILPLGKYVSQVCKAYKQHLGLAFTVLVPRLCNITLVACRAKALTGGAREQFVGRELVLGTLVSKSYSVESTLNLLFPCLQYIKRGFMLVD